MATSKVIEKIQKNVLRQVLRVSMNKANAAAFKESKNIIKEKYGLPTKIGDGDYSTYRTALKEVLSNHKIDSVGGIDSEIPTRIKALDKNIGGIRLLEEKTKNIEDQKKKKVSSRRRVAMKMGQGRKTIVKRRFVARANGNLHLFQVRRNKKIQRVVVPSTYTVLKKRDHQERMREAAEKKMEEIFVKEFSNRVSKYLN